MRIRIDSHCRLDLFESFEFVFFRRGQVLTLVNGELLELEQNVTKQRKETLEAEAAAKVDHNRFLRLQNPTSQTHAQPGRYELGDFLLRHRGIK